MNYNFIKSNLNLNRNRNLNFNRNPFEINFYIRDTKSY